MTRARFFFTALVFCAALSSGCNVTNVKEFKIGFLGTKSGALAYSGTLAWQAAVLAEDQWNALHPASQIRIQYRDNGSDSTQSVGDFQELWASGIRIFVGPMQSSDTTAIYPQTFKLNALIVAPMVAAPSFSKIDDLFISLFPPATEFGKALGRDLHARACKRLAVVTDFNNRALSLSMFDEVVNALHLDDPGAAVTLHDHWMIKSDAKPGDLDARVQSWKKGSVDCVLMIIQEEQITAFAAAMDRAAFKAALFASPGAIYESLLKLGALEGLSFYLPFQIGNTDPKYLKFKEVFERRFAQLPSMASAYTYETVDLVATALQEVGIDDPGKVKERIVRRGAIQGLQGSYSIDRFGDAKREILHYRISNGKFEEVSGR